MQSGMKRAIQVFIGFIFIILVVSEFSCQGGKKESPAELPAKPNILWLVAEDLSPNIPPFGDSTIQTPALSRLAAKGIRYINVYSVSGVCSPSRAAIATGMYPSGIGAHHMRTLHQQPAAREMGIIDYECVPPYLPETDAVVQDVRRMYSNIVEMDRHVGLVLKQLEEDGLLENTIIVWYADHGGPLPRQKRLVYDSGLKVPMIIRFPGKWRAGEIDDRLISFIDFAPTLLSMCSIQPPEYMDGQAFEGKYQSHNPRKYIHAAADRFDEKYDMIRAVRDKRFKYLKNFQPKKGYYLALDYREKMATMQELLRLRNEGKLNEIQMQWLRSSKPVEELFDTDNDPHEINNLAGDPAYAEKLSELRAECERWIEEIGDMGLIPEEELINQFWPGKIQPVTGAPVVKKEDGKIQLHCDTEGASIGYKLGSDEVPWKGWRIYSEPFEIPEGESVKIVAHRIGYAPSDTLVVSKQ